MAIDENLERFPASIDDAILVRETPEVPEAPEVPIRPRSNAAEADRKTSNPPKQSNAPLYFQCPACRSTLSVDIERLKTIKPAPCGHCAIMIMPPVVAPPKESDHEPPQRKKRFISGGLFPPK